MKKRMIRARGRGKEFKNVAVIWDEIDGKPKIIRMMLSHPKISAEKRAAKAFPKAKRGTCHQIEHTCKAIEKLLSGKKVKFSLGILDLKRCTPFHQKVLKACSKIPRGRVSTYQNLAKKIGDKKASRAIGNAMANNPFPLIVPCHRVIAANRSLGGFQCGLKIKRALLENEGIRFDEKGRVDHGFHRCSRI